MANSYRIITKDTDGKQRVTPCEPVHLRVRSDQIIPSGCTIMYSAFIVDKMEVAMCDGQDNWYVSPDRPVRAGQPFSDLFR